MDDVSTASLPVEAVNDSVPRASWYIGTFAAIVWIGVVLFSCFLDRRPAFDEIGLHNPVYMFLHYGKMTYPAHGHHDDMVVHPPMAYAVMALFMKMGFSLFHAAGLPLCIMGFLCFWLIWRGPFTEPVKLGLIAGFFMAIFLWPSIIKYRALTLRPDTHLAMAWFTGLVALESARLDGWKLGRLFLGGLLLAFGASMHYIGAAVGGGVFVYAVWALCAAPRGRKIKAILALGGGAALVAIPYAMFWLIPSWSPIMTMTRAVQGEGGPKEAVQSYLNAYQAWKAFLPYQDSLVPVVAGVTKPFLAWTIPAAAVGVVLMLLLRSTRGIAIAGLPQLLFVIFFVRGGLKQSAHRGYYEPEFILFYGGLLAVTLTVGCTVLCYLVGKRRQKFVVLGLAALLLFGLLVDTRKLGGQLTPSLDDLDVARASGRAIAGRDAVVGIFSAGVWYAGGGTGVYFITPDLIYPQDLGSFDAKAYFEQFDALVLHPFGAAITYNKQRKSMVSYYEDKTLSLKGFYFSDRRWWHESDIAYLTLATKKCEPILGFGHKDGRLFRFDQHAQGDSVFACYACPVTEFSNESLGFVDFYVQVRRPGETAQQESSTMFCVFVMPRAEYEKRKPGFLAKGRLQDEVIVRRSEVSLSEFLAQFHADDQTIRFYRNFDEVKKSKRAQIASH